MGADGAAGVTVRHDLRPGDLGRIVAMHGELYAREYGFGPGFEAYVAETVAEYGRLARPDLDRIWLAERGGRLLGSIAILGRARETGAAAGPDGDRAGAGSAAPAGGVAQLRWFLVDPAARGAGLGRRLVAEALAFCRAAGYGGVYLWTVNGLDAAAHLYRAVGFVQTEAKPPAELWGVRLSEERYDLTL